MNRAFSDRISTRTRSRGTPTTAVHRWIPRTGCVAAMIGLWACSVNGSISSTDLPGRTTERGLTTDHRPGDGSAVGVDRAGLDRATVDRAVRPPDLTLLKPDLRRDSGPPQYVTAGLLAAFSFDEGSGLTVHDRSGHGHDAVVNGSHAWETGKLHLIDSSPASYGWASVPRGTLLEGSWTVSVWFEAKSAGNGSAGRVLSGAESIGGEGPEWFFQSGLKVAMRINGNTCLWNVPTVGTRSTPAPPGHFALPTEAIKANTCYHYLVTHDEPAKRVRAFQAAASATTMELVFDGTYSNSYDVSASDIRLSHSHHPTEPRYFDGKYYQLLFYNRVLTQAEIDKQHGAGRDSVH